MIKNILKINKKLKTNQKYKIYIKNKIIKISIYIHYIIPKQKTKII